MGVQSKKRSQSAAPAAKKAKLASPPSLDSSDFSESDAESASEQESESEDELDDLDSDNEAGKDDDESDDVEGSEDKEVDPNKKSSKEQHAEQRKLLSERKLKRKSGNEVQQIKSLWEKLRVKKPTPPKQVREKLTNEIWELSKDVILDLVMKHDASRVVQTLVKYASKEKRDIIVKQLKGNYYQLATSSYGKYLLVKLLHYGSKESRALIVDELHGKLRKLMRHKEGAYVVEDLYVIYSTAEQKRQMIREFWGAEYAVFKDSGKGKSVVEIANESAEKKQLITSNLIGTITASVEKGSTGFQILHAAMKDYISILVDDLEKNDSKIREFIELLAEQFAELVHTKDGSEVAQTLIALASAKERKVIVRSLKPHASNLIKNEYGNLVLITLYMTVDDTVLIHKTLNVELFTDETIPEIIGDKYARRPLLYLLKGLDGRYFNPKIKEELTHYEKLAYNKTSKKPQEQRRSELSSKCIPIIFKAILSTTNSEDPEKSFRQLLSVNMAAQFISELILSPAEVEDIDSLRQQLIDAIFDVSIKGDILEDYHLINKSPFLPRCLKALIRGKEIKWDNEAKKLVSSKSEKLAGTGPELAERIANEILGENKLLDWANGQSSSFVLVDVYEVLRFDNSKKSKEFEKALKKVKKSISNDSDNKGVQVLMKIL